MGQGHGLSLQLQTLTLPPPGVLNQSPCQADGPVGRKMFWLWLAPSFADFFL